MFQDYIMSQDGSFFVPVRSIKKVCVLRDDFGEQETYQIHVCLGGKSTDVLATYATERRAKEVLLELLIVMENGETRGYKFPQRRITRQ